MLCLAVYTTASAIGPPGEPVSFYLQEDFEPPVPLGEGAGNMTRYGIGDHQGTTTIIDTAASWTAESQSMNFTKLGTGGYFKAYATGSSTPDTVGYVIDVVFRVNSDVTLVDRPRVLETTNMSSIFWVTPNAVPGTCDLVGWQGSTFPSIAITKDEWHRLQGIRVKPTGTIWNAETMDYFIDGYHWWRGTQNIAEGVYGNRIDVGYHYNPSVGSIDFDHLWMYEPEQDTQSNDYFYSGMESYAQNAGVWARHGTIGDVTVGTTDAYAYAGDRSMRFYKAFPTGSFFYYSTYGYSDFQVPELGLDGYTASCNFYVPTVAEQLASDEGVATPYNDLRLMYCYDEPDTDTRIMFSWIDCAAYEDPGNPGQYIDVKSPYINIAQTTHIKVGVLEAGLPKYAYLTRGEWHKVTFYRKSETVTDIWYDYGVLLGTQQNWSGKYMNRVDIPSASASSIGEVFIDEVLVTAGAPALPTVSIQGIGMAVKVGWSGDVNADYRVEYDDGGNWIVLGTVTGTEYFDTETTDPAERTYRVFRIPKTYFSEDAEGTAWGDLWQHDATVGTDIAPFDYSTTVANSPTHSLWLRDQTVSEFSNGHTNPGFSVGIPHTLAFNVFIPPNGDQFLNYTVMGIAATGPGVYDPNRIFTDVKFDILSGSAVGGNLTLTMTYGDGLGDTTTSTASLPQGQWNEIVVERTAAGSVNVELNSVQILSGVAPFDGSAGNDAKTLWIGQMYDPVLQDSKGNMYLDDITVTDIAAEVQVTPVSTQSAVTIWFDSEKGPQYLVWSADEPGGPYINKQTYTGTGGIITWSDGNIESVGRRFYKVSVDVPQ